MTASFQAKDPFLKETIQAKNDPSLSWIHVAHKIWASQISLQVASKALAWWRYREGTGRNDETWWPAVDLFSTSVAASCSSKARTGMVCQNDHFPNRPGLLLRMRTPYPKKNDSESPVDISLQTCQSFAFDKKILMMQWTDEKKSLVKPRALFTNQEETNRRQDGLDGPVRQVRIGFLLSSTMTRLAAGSASCQDLWR